MSDAAITCIVMGLITILTTWMKLHYGVEKKIDDNTVITQNGNEAAVIVAETAAVNATEAKAAAQFVARKLNGGMDAAIKAAIEPLQQSVVEHAEKDEKNMEEISSRFAGMEKYIHDRNHDILAALDVEKKMLQLMLKLDPRYKDLREGL